VILNRWKSRFTKKLLGLRCLSYDERLQKLGLPRLELRWLHLELIFCYKIVFDLVYVNLQNCVNILQTKQVNLPAADFRCHTEAC